MRFCDGFSPGKEEELESAHLFSFTQPPPLNEMVPVVAAVARQCAAQASLLLLDSLQAGPMRAPAAEGDERSSRAALTCSFPDACRELVRACLC